MSVLMPWFGVQQKVSVSPKVREETMELNETNIPFENEVRITVARRQLCFCATSAAIMYFLRFMHIYYSKIRLARKWN